MNISPNNEKIEKYLDELAKEYKVLLYKALVSRSKPLDDLSVSELLRLDNEIKKPLFEDYQRQQRRRRMLFIVGLTYMLMGVFCFFLLKIINGYNDFENTIFLISGVFTIIGLFATLFSLAFQTLGIYPKKSLKRSEEYTALLEYEVVAKWREIEGIVNDISLNANVKTPRSIICFLLENHFIDDNEYVILKDFLKIRNNIVHSTNNLYSESAIKEIIDKVDNIIDRIKKIM